MLEQWKQSAIELVPKWNYTSVAQTEGQQPKKSVVVSLRECVVSKVFWRIIILFATILLLLNLLSPAKDTLARYGWYSSGSPGSDILDHPPPSSSVDWSEFAYCQYVTNEDYLCNSVMLFESLNRLGAQADCIMMYPQEWIASKDTRTGRLLTKARDEYGVELVPIEVQHFAGDSTWSESFTKLLAFNQTQYKRVLSLDSDSTVLQPMDELFLLPTAPVAMPRAYWLGHSFLSSQLVLVEPSEFEFNRILEALKTRNYNEYDMEIVNELYGESCFIIPHRRYDLLTGEFKHSPDEHFQYLGSKEEGWDPDAVLEEAKFLHFSDFPFPKPWLRASDSEREKNQPQCRDLDNGEQDCRDRDHWLSFYTDFKERRAVS